jgi:hypothetical protein
MQTQGNGPLLQAVRKYGVPALPFFFLLVKHIILRYNTG